MKSEYIGKGRFKVCYCKDCDKTIWGPYTMDGRVTPLKFQKKLLFTYFVALSAISITVVVVGLSLEYIWNLIG